jgi:hypothetical protein
MAQSAVEWIIQQLPSGYRNNRAWGKIIKQGKEMEKEKMIKFANDYIDNYYKKIDSYYYSPHLTPEEFFNEKYGNNL